MVIDVIDLSGTQCQISGGFNSGTVIIQYTGFTCGGAIRIQRATDMHITCTVNQAVRPVIQGLYPQVHTLTPGQCRRHAIFFQIIKCGSADTNSIAVDSPGTGIRQGVRLKMRIFPVNQPTVQQCVRHVKPGLPGTDFTFLCVFKADAVQVKPAACQQAAGIRDIAINGKRKVSVRNSLTTVAERCVTFQRHIAQRKQFPVTTELTGIHRY